MRVRVGVRVGVRVRYAPTCLQMGTLAAPLFTVHAAFHFLGRVKLEGKDEGKDRFRGCPTSITGFTPSDGLKRVSWPA